jgi:mRNA interferase RelE/StbE
MSDTIVIERAEYERLVEAAEELADLRAYDGAKADLASGADELLPAEFVERVLGGESLLRAWRNFRRLTQMQLAEKAQVNRVQIADIEAGKSVGSVETVRKLAAALGVTIDDLV